jgi:hypothetical protein
MDMRGPRVAKREAPPTGAERNGSSPAMQATVSSPMASLVVVRDRDIGDDAEQHQEPKQGDEDREYPAFGHAIASPHYPRPTGGDTW